jgi:hypothetical protein
MKKGRKADSPNSHNSINELVHTQPPYSDHGPVPEINEEDFIYTGRSTDGLIQDNTGKHLMLNLKDDVGQGYVVTFNIGVNATNVEQTNARLQLL